MNSINPDPLPLSSRKVQQVRGTAGDRKLEGEKGGVFIPPPHPQHITQASPFGLQTGSGRMPLPNTAVAIGQSSASATASSRFGEPLLTSLHAWVGGTKPPLLLALRCFMSQPL